MSETYTAVYARDGEEWVANIAEQPGLSVRAGNVAEAREQIRTALGQALATGPTDLRVIDQFSLPAQIRTIQSTVKAERTEETKAAMVASMTASRSAKDWAADLQESQRAPAAVKWLGSLEGDLDVDEMCFAITVAEEMGRWGDGEAEEKPAEG